MTCRTPGVRALGAALACLISGPFLLLAPQHAAAAGIAKVQSGPEVTSSTGNLTVTLSSASTAGNLLVATVSNLGGTTSTPFSAPSGWVFATGLWQTSNGRTEIWYYAGNPGGISSAAFTSSSSSIGAVGQMSEWSGVAATSVLDKSGTTAVTSATSATVSSSAATSVNGELGVTAFSTTMSETSYSAGTGWTHLFSDGSWAAGADYQLGLPAATASETETASSTSTGWILLIATFEPVQVPGAVSGLSATAGAAQATVSWTAPSAGGPVASYVLTALSGGTANRNTTALPAGTTSATVTGLTPGTPYKFAVYAVNGGGNGATATTTAAVTPTATQLPAYASAVLADSPTFYYRMDETAGTTMLDSSGNSATGTEVSTPTQGSAGALASDTDTGVKFNGSTQYAYSAASYANPTTFSIEAWFKTTTTTGGKIVGFGSAQTGNSANYDRHVYMSNTGQLYFGVYTTAVASLNSTASYNDGNSHHVMATLSSAGMFLYVDGAQVASNTTTTTAQNYTGYWRVGEDALSGWSAVPTSNYFNGTIDEVAVYPTALSLARDQIHYCDGSNSTASFCPPAAVSSLSATPGSNQATVSWSAPAVGGPVSGYIVVALSGGTAARNTTKIPGTSVTMTGLTAGTVYKFQLTGENAAGTSAAVTSGSVTPSGTTNPYTQAVLTDSPTFYYRMDETAGTTMLDSSGNSATATEVSAPTQGSAGALATDTDTGVKFNGSTQYAYSAASYANPTTFSIEAWFKTTTTTGGKIVGFGSSQTGNSASYDRHIYMSNSGQLYFGVYPAAVVTINSIASYNDGNSHHVVATLSSAGMFLYVDGAQVASNTTTATAQNYTGYWRIGEDASSNWTASPTSSYFNGTIDEVAVYPVALSLARVQVHYCDGSNNSCLSMTGPSSIAFPGVALDGLDHTVTATATFDVVDNSGGNGWNLLATSTTLTAGAHGLPLTSITVQSAPATACDGGYTCTLATNSITYPYSLPAGGTAPPATKLFDAAVATGQGHQTVSVTFTLTVPGNAFAGSYSSACTFSIASGP